MRLRNSVLSLLLWGLACAVQAQPVVLTVDTNLADAVVYADSQRLGTAAQGPFAVSSTTRRVRLVSPAGWNWSIAPVETPLAALPGDTVRLPLRFPHYYQVQSVPYGAPVYHVEGTARTSLGKTPLVYTSETPLGGTLVIDRPGYAIEEIEPGVEVWNAYEIRLHPTRPAKESTKEIAWDPPQQRRLWIDVAAVGLALSATALAVHYKFKADRLYDRYQDSGDPALRPRVETYDQNAAIALGVSQVGLGIFAVRLALR